MAQIGDKGWTKKPSTPKAKGPLTDVKGWSGGKDILSRNEAGAELGRLTTLAQQEAAIQQQIRRSVDPNAPSNKVIAGGYHGGGTNYSSVVNPPKPTWGTTIQRLLGAYGDSVGVPAGLSQAQRDKAAITMADQYNMLYPNDTTPAIAPSTVAPPPTPPFLNLFNQDQLRPGLTFMNPPTTPPTKGGGFGSRYGGWGGGGSGWGGGDSSSNPWLNWLAKLYTWNPG